MAVDLEAPRILIARMSALGDTILTLPVACALRDRYPDAFLAWVVERGAASALRNHEDLDQVIELPRGWFVSPIGIASARAKLRRLKIDVAIDCQSITKTALACWLSGAATRIGCDGRYGCELSPWLNNLLIEPESRHLIDRSLELIEPLGVDRPRIRWRYPLADPALEAMASYVQQQNLETGYAVINPGATWQSKLWEMGRFGQVAGRLARDAGVPSIVVWGNPVERDWAEQVVEASSGGARLAPRTSLEELAALLLGARLVLSADTGPLHMAVAVGAPTVGLYGATLLEDCGPYGAPHIGLQKDYESGSRSARRKADNTAMRAITVEDAYQACLRLIDQRGQRVA